ncbi:MAG: ABC transporter ATP-binding protein [Oscillospiraceae bacterium]|jgi:simple sugar transport system ATP-binding protein|nr:ABC transporter ATP-binding protein [Oscillospiraceae bacterium]MCI1990926.1 ABC transporter ATP-binding protein [Oscillospiraceae bacterium]MCI2035871.1 ABC transporter ATP-binding protein [Oscillospiraceae bacterium]
MDQPVIEMLHITKKFSKVVANDDVSLSIGKGEVVALLGENGAGKSTIMKILYGLYRADEGVIRVDGVPCRIGSSRDAIRLGISMIQQNFSLVPAHTVTENIILGNCRGLIDYRRKEREIAALAETYGFDVPAGELVRNLTVGAQQKVEILKALYLNARVLIMDEPTAVLTPQETDRLMEFVRQYVQKGNSVVFITHKMREVMDVSTRIVIMRGGRICGAVKKEDADETALSRMMIGHSLEHLTKPAGGAEEKPVGFSVRNLSIRRKSEPPLLEDISFDIHKGEIIGFAGVSGNGQQELCEAICGARPVTDGSVVLDGRDITHLSIRRHIESGIGYVVSDRLRYGMVMNLSIAENLLLKESYGPKWRKHGLLDRKRLNRYAEEVIRRYSVKAPDPSVPGWSLSGGNQQKIVVAREVEAGKKMILFDQPTRGLDLGAIHYVHKTILEEKAKGKCILLVSTELSEIFTLSDRIVVLYRGKIAGIYKPSEVDAGKIGLLMSGYRNGEEKR